jgi:hypothetical protein
MPVVGDEVVHDRVEAAAGDGHPGADGAGRRGASRRGRRVVVVVDVVVHHHPARGGAGDRAGPAARAPAVLRSGRIPDDGGVGVQAVLVVVELGVLDDDGPAGVGAGVPERVVLHPHVVQRHVAPPQAGAHVRARVVHVAGVELVPAGRAGRVAREDAVLGGGALVAEERRGGGEVAAPVPGQADRAGLGSAVPPDLVARRSRARQEVADREVFDAHVVRLPHQDPVAADRGSVRPGRPVVLSRRPGTARRRSWPGAVDDDRAAVHAAQGDAGLGDVDAAHLPLGGVAARAGLVGVLVVIARADQDKVARHGSSSFPGESGETVREWQGLQPQKSPEGPVRYLAMSRMRRCLGGFGTGDVSGRHDRYLATLEPLHRSGARARERLSHPSRYGCPR